MPKSKGRNKKAQRRGKSLGPVRRTAGLPAASIDPQSVPADPERQLGYGATVMLGGVVDPPGITYFDDRVEAVLTKRGWTSARSDGNVPDGDAWAFDTRGGDYLAASRAYIYVTRDHIVADAAEESGIPSRRYNSVEELEADLDEIEAWPHEDDLAPR
jgi:hypothetical protein